MIEQRELWRISSLLIFVINRERTLLLRTRIDRINTILPTWLSGSLYPELLIVDISLFYIGDWNEVSIVILLMLLSSSASVSSITMMNACWLFSLDNGAPLRLLSSTRVFNNFNSICFLGLPCTLVHTSRQICLKIPNTLEYVKITRPLLCNWRFLILCVFLFRNSVLWYVYLHGT